MAHHFQQMPETKLFLLRASFGLQKVGQVLEPLVEATSNLSIADLLWAVGPRAIQDVLQPHDPFAHSSDLLKRFSLLCIQTHDSLEPFEPLLARLAHRCPLFSSVSRLL